MGDSPTRKNTADATGATTATTAANTAATQATAPTTDTTDGLISNLKGLIAGAIVGVASFQILAPTVWGYIHDLLNLSYKTSYWIFTLGYFLTMPLFMLVWLALNGKKLIVYFPPYELRDKVKRLDAGVLRSLFLFICLQLLVAGVTFRFYFWPWFYWVILSFYVLVCGGFMVFYGVAARKRMRFEYPGPAGCPPAITKYYRQLILISVPFYFILFGVAFFYLHKWKGKKDASHYMGTTKSAFNAGSRGFALGNLQDSLNSRYAGFAKIEDSIRYEHRNDALHSIDSLQYYITRRIVTDTIHIRPDSSLIAYDKALAATGQSISQLFHRLRDTTTEVGERFIISISQHIPYYLNYSTGNSLHTIDDLQYILLLENYLAELSKQAGAQSQAQLGLQLQAMQLKGMVLLLSLFFTLFSLFVYLSICRRLLQAKQSDDAKEVSTLSNNLWLYLTVIVWLLVPLFKPVKDADIDVKQTYKAHTMGNF